MSLIEGIGDEVVLVFSALVAVAVLVIAWLSTSVRDYPWRSVIIVQCRRHPHRPGQSDQVVTAEISPETLANFDNRPENDADGDQQQQIVTAARENAVASVSDTVQQETTVANDSSLDDTRESLRHRRNNQSEIRTNGTALESEQVSEHSVTKPPSPALGETHSAKTTLEEASQIRVRLKYLNERERTVQANSSDTIGEFRRNHFEQEVSAGKIVKFISNGQVLANDGQSLQSYGINNNCVLHVLLTQPQLPEQPLRHEPDAEFDVGNLMFPMFGFVLAAVWYCRIQYKHYFNATATLTLIGITVLFGLSAFAVWRNSRDTTEDSTEQRQR